MTKSSPNTYFLIFRRPPQGAAPTPEEMQRNFEEWVAWIDGLRARGTCVGGFPLQTDGTVVRATRSKAVTDGPFVEGKEICGGFIAVVARDLDQATEFARGCPGYKTGHSVEIRALPGAYDGPRESKLEQGPGYLFVFRDPINGVDPSPEQVDALGRWIDRLKSERRALAAGALQPVPARILKGTRGEHVVDGPFAEAKEIFAGYMVIQGGSLAEATEIARSCPILAAGTSIEVRTLGLPSEQMLETIKASKASRT